MTTELRDDGFEMGAKDPYPEDADENTQIEWLRRATPTQRVHRALMLSQAAIEEARRAIKEANPEASEDELKVLFVAKHYGEDLAVRFRDYIAKQREKERAPCG